MSICCIIISISNCYTACGDKWPLELHKCVLAEGKRIFCYVVWHDYDWENNVCIMAFSGGD